ncbi:hypothetical protein SR914_05235 [Comamonas testosteroni]|jgi:hypothetical protein|uniref:Uncharacterized protein n=1 Tax=Comamonas testosteroni (strain DSM 14576 / KF-1) TaxID=399795 RepID=B7WZ61_COMTK|nr:MULTISPECIES: hypothetical protein [Comamonas]EED69862.1 hypothetical protein CtesDRAFT_PD4810 [Comamonas testosteroni KF-1]MPS91426.1 hypothetical protein [Comamonas sp.]TYK71682.1 hypothetical protein FSY59_11090 [Comamonas sp. Z3]WQG67807.1 hypothetical protein SR914_05235 [Comamonas testosteroni]
MPRNDSVAIFIKNPPKPKPALHRQLPKQEYASAFPIDTDKVIAPNELAFLPMTASRFGLPAKPYPAF